MTPGELFVMPAALPILLLVPLAWVLWRSLDRARARKLVLLLGARAPVLARERSAGERRLRRGLAVGALALALIAILQPQWGAGVRRIEQRGVDLLVCLDVSRSMLARDLAPTRLERARSEIKALAGHLEGDRMGLVIFAGESRMVAPLTRDMVAFAELVDLVDPLDVSRGGTDLGAALAAAGQALSGASGEHEVVLLLTDGEDLAARGRAVAAGLGQRNVRVHCVGFGSAPGSKIAIPAEEGEVFLRDRSGEDVVSALDAPGLRAIAAATGGAYIDAASARAPLVELYERELRPMSRKAFGGEDRPARPNRYQWPLLAAFVLWILELCLTDRKRR